SGGYDRLIAVLSKGALIENAEVQWGRLHLSQGATVSGATVTGGSLDIYDPAGDQGKDRPAALVNEATVAGGRIFFRGSNASGAHIVISTTAAEAGSNTNHIQNGAYVSGLTIRAGKMVEHYNGSLVDGDLAPLVEDVKVSGGNFSVGWGTAKNVWISGGNMVLFGVAGHGTVVENLAISGGKVTALSNGVLVSNATLTGSKVANTVVSWGSMDMYAAGSGRDIVVSGGQLTVSGGATIDNLTVTGSGGSVYTGDVTSFQGAKLVVSDARVNNLVVSGAKVANNAASLNTGAVVSGGLVYGINKSNCVYMAGNAKWNEVTVSRGNIYMNNGGSVTNLTQKGCQVIARGNNAYVSGADVTGSGEIYAQNGGRLYDITVSDGGYLEIRYQNAGATGHFAENVTIGQGGRANVMRYGILRDVTVSNGGLVRVGNNGPDYLYRGYVSGALIRSGGTMVLSSGGWVSGTIAEKGANLAIYISPEGDETYASIQSNGVDFTVTDTTVTGLTEINSGTSLLLFSGAVFDASQIGSIGQGGNIVVTSTTTATGARVAAGGLLTVSSGGHVTGVTVNEGGTAVVHIGEGTYAEVGTVTVDGTTITGLAEGITSGVTIAVDNGIVFNGQTLLAGGGVQIEAGGSVGGLTATGGTLTLKGGYLSAATVGADTTVNATGGTISGGTINATLNVNGGTVYAQSKAVLANVVIASGAVLSAIQNTSSVQITNATVEAGGKLDLATGGAYVSGLLVKEGATFKTADNNVLVGTGINIAAGAWNVMPTEAVVDGVLDANGSKFRDIGAFYFGNGFTVENAECNIYMYLSNGAQARDITATTKNGVALQNGGYAYNVKVDGEGAGYFFIHQFNGGSGVALGGAETDIAQGKVYNVAGNFDKPYDWYVDKGVVKQLSLGSGATYAYDVQKMHLREGIKADAPVVSSGGTLYISAGVEVANAKLFNAGGIRVYDGALLSGTTATGGNMWVSNTGVVKDTLLSGYGIMTVSEGGYASGITLDRAGNANNPQVKVEAANAVAEAVTISSGGILYVSNGGVASDVTVLSFGSASIAGGGTISGAVLRDDYFNTSGNPHTAIYMTNGLVNDVDVIRGNIHAAGTGTVTNLRQSGAQVIMRGANTFVSGAVVTGKREGRTTDHELGRLYFQDDAVGSDITVGSGGMIYAYRFTGNDFANQRATDIDINKGGSAVASKGGSFYDIRIHDGGMMTVASAGYASGVTVDNNATVYVSSGAQISDLAVANGGVIHALEDAAITDLHANTGATVDYANGLKTSGAMIRGDKTNVAAGTLVYQGKQLDATITDGVMTNLGNNGNNYRMRVGEGITVQNVKLGNGDRLYVHETAVVDGGTIN
ncbi:MAG: hypothetical protein J6Y54_09885, partial [Lentisphaeria bacterium]|nr:hypothetical protein [Lentisphaeria bacterium]